MDSDTIFWIVVAVIVAVSKIAGKIKEAAGARGESPQPVRRSRPRSRRPASAQSPPPVIRRAKPTGWQVSQEKLQDFVRQLQTGMTPPPVAMVPEAVAAPQPTRPSLAPPAPRQPTHAPQPYRARPNRAHQWATALRDRSNLRNIIIAAEIIGPPKAS